MQINKRALGHLTELPWPRYPAKNNHFFSFVERGLQKDLSCEVSLNTAKFGQCCLDSIPCLFFYFFFGFIVFFMVYC